MHSNTQRSHSHHIHFSQKSLYILPPLVSGMRRALDPEGIAPDGRICGLLQRGSSVSEGLVITLTDPQPPAATVRRALPPRGARSPRVFSFPQRRNTSLGWNCVLARSSCHARLCRPHRCSCRRAALGLRVLACGEVNSQGAVMSSRRGGTPRRVHMVQDPKRIRVHLSLPQQ